MVAASSASLQRKLPVTALSDFLGAGKTTVFNHVLASRDGLCVAISRGEIVTRTSTMGAAGGDRRTKTPGSESTTSCVCDYRRWGRSGVGPARSGRFPIACGRRR